MKTLALMLILASPLWAEDRPAPNFDPKAMAVPGAVATLVSAERLHDLGLAAKDPLMVLAAARMLRGVLLAAADRKAEGGTTAPARAVLPEVAAILDEARALAQGDALLPDVIEAVAAEVPVARVSVQESAGSVEAGGSATWQISFYGGVYGEVAVLGAAAAALHMVVADHNGNIVCQNLGAGESGLCGFVPLENGYFSVTVTNDGVAAADYVVVTN